MALKYVYISGPVTGRDYQEAKAEFRKAENAIKAKHGNKVVVVNPFDFCTPKLTWEEAMRKCISRLAYCDYIHCLPDFYKSRGARLEMQIAEELKLGVCNDIYELEDFDNGKK